MKRQQTNKNIENTWSLNKMFKENIYGSIKYFVFRDHIYGRYTVLKNIVWFNETARINKCKSKVMIGSDIRENELEFEYVKMIRREKLERILKI